MDKLEQITERLRQQQPKMNDEDAFVNGIMALIDERNPMPHIPLWIRVVRVVSSMAAAFLIMLFVWQQIEVEGEGDSARLSHIGQGEPVMTAQEPQAMVRISARDEVTKYLADREKRHEMRKHSIRHNYARL